MFDRRNSESRYIKDSMETDTKDVSTCVFYFVRRLPRSFHRNVVTLGLFLGHPIGVRGGQQLVARF